MITTQVAERIRRRRDLQDVLYGEVVFELFGDDRFRARPILRRRAAMDTALN